MRSTLGICTNALSVLGLASLIDGVVVWMKFLQDMIGLYQQIIRQPVENLLTRLLPQDLVSIEVLADVAIVWGLSAIALQIAKRGPYRVWFGEISSNVWKKISLILLGPIGVPLALMLEQANMRYQIYLSEKNRTLAQNELFKLQSIDEDSPRIRELLRTQRGLVTSSDRLSDMEAHITESNRALRNHYHTLHLRMNIEIAKTYLVLCSALLIFIFINWQVTEACKTESISGFLAELTCNSP